MSPRPLRLLGAAVCFVLLQFGIFAENPDKSQRVSYNNPTGSPLFQLININNITTWLSADGKSNRTPRALTGVLYPRGTAGVLYQDGIVWGGKAFLDSNNLISPYTQAIRVGGQTYNVGTQAGRIIGEGSTAVPADPNNPDVRMYRLRRDYYEMSTDELRRDAAEYFEVPVSTVTQQQIDQIKNQYGVDWIGWPVQYGAPYIERNGIPGYQSPPQFTQTFTVDSLIRGHYDEPGLAGINTSLPAHQVMWTVYNDLNHLLTVNLYGSEPIGLEVQVTAWGYKHAGALGQIYFKRFRFINKGGVAINANGDKGAFYIDSMYISQWSDPDVGDAADDLCGVDTSLGLGYAYNGNAIDQDFFRWQLPPPAVGYDFVIGPAVPSLGDSAVVNFHRRYGFKNLLPTSFVYFSPNGVMPDPVSGYASTLQWWRMLRGYRPDASGIPLRWYPFPPGMTPGPFPLSGDPVMQSGFIDGQGTEYSLFPSDRRIALSTGPFRLAFRDTQEIVLACVGGVGADRLSSISVMRLNSRTAQSFANTLLKLSPPGLTANVSYPTTSQANVRLLADTRGSTPSAVRLTLTDPPSTIVAELDLYDDGTHGDTLASDNIWTNTIALARRSRGMNVSASVRFASTESYQWDQILEGVTTAGLLNFENFRIFSDNLNNNGDVNPGENIRYGFTTVNNSAFDLGVVKVAPSMEPDIKTRAIATLPISGRDSMIYVMSQSASYFTFDIPRTFTDSLYALRINASDNQNNRWTGVFVIPVRQFSSQVQRAILTHTAGIATGEFEILTVNPSAIRNHLYVIRGIDSINASAERGITLKDSTDGRILLFNHPMPDSLGHNMPVTDGFKVRRGTIDLTYGFLNWDVPNGQLRFSSANAYINFEGFGGAIGWDDPAHFFGITAAQAVPASALRMVKLKLAEASSGTVFNPQAGDPPGNPYGGWDINNPGTDTNYSHGYRYLRGASSGVPARPEFAPYLVNATPGYAYQDYKRGIPLSAWNMDTTPPTRLAVGHMENNVVQGLVDGKWWPAANGTGAAATSGTNREWLFVFNRPYTGSTPVAELQRDILNNGLPVMWWLTVTRLNGTNFFAGDEFLIRVKHPPSSRDAWTFNPTIVTGVGGETLPESFSLGQNYPNPFNPTTTIRFELPVRGRIVLTIYNVLGQEIRTLLSEQMEAGSHSCVWDGRNNSGAGVATGVYFYRITADGIASFVQVKKMVLLR